MYRVVLVGVIVEEVIISFRSRFLIFLYFPVKQRCAIVLLCVFKNYINIFLKLCKEKQLDIVSPYVVCLPRCD